MSDIIEARKRIGALMESHPEIKPELDEIMSMMFRRSPARRAATKTRMATPTLKARILAYARRNPELSYKEIGEHFNVNIGRVSEALNARS